METGRQRGDGKEEKAKKQARQAKGIEGEGGAKEWSIVRGKRGRNMKIP